MSKFKILQYGYFKYARWPHTAMTIQTTSQYIDVLRWLKANLNESQYRINQSKADWYFPNTTRQVGYHFKDSADLSAAIEFYNEEEFTFYYLKFGLS